MTQTKAELLQTRHQGDIRLGDADSTHYVGFKAPATVGTSLVWTLPAADGSSNQILKTDGSGTLSWATDSATDSTKMPLAGGIFTGDVTFTGAAANIVFDKSDNALEFADNTKALFGTGADMWLIHDGSNSTLQSETGNLRVRTVGQFQLTKSSTENMLIAVPDGAVELYYDSAKKLETVTGGATVTGTISAGAGSFTDDGSTASGPVLNVSGDDSNVWFGRLGNETYHNSTATGFKFYVANNGILNLAHHGNAEYLAWSMSSNNGTTNKYNIYCNATQQVYLYNSTTYVLSTTPHGVNHHKGVTQTASAMSALDIDLRESTYFTKTISGNSTFTFSNPPASGTTGSFTLELTHSSGTVTWPSSVKWNSDTAPTLTTGKTHLFMFVTDDGGTRYRGAALVDYVN